MGCVRHILLVRHAHCLGQTGELGLTALGKAQASSCGSRLAAMAPPHPEATVSFGCVHSSPAASAVETAHIIAHKLSLDLVSDPDPLLEEGVPTALLRGDATGKVKPHDVHADGFRVEAAFRKYVHRHLDHKRLYKAKGKEAITEAFHPERSSADEEGVVPGVCNEHTYEICVCHANLIRYFVMRALQLPPEAWIRLRGEHASVTEIVVHPDGRVELARFADVGHLPARLQTIGA